MKNFLHLVACLLLAWTSGHAADEVLRIKLEWLNAKDCGLEGCKPQNVIMKEGTSMSFGWPELKERGYFELAPSLRGETAILKLKRMLKAEKGMETVAAVEPELPIGKSRDVVVGDVSLRITIIEEQSASKK